MSEITAWLDETGIDDPEDRDAVRQIVLAMDAEYRSWVDMETKAKTRPKGRRR